MPTLLCQFGHCVLLYQRTSRSHKWECPGCNHPQQNQVLSWKICQLLLEPFSLTCSHRYHLGPHNSPYPQCSAVTLDKLWVNPGSTVHAQMEELQYSKDWKRFGSNLDSGLTARTRLPKISSEQVGRFGISPHVDSISTTSHSPFLLCEHTQPVAPNWGLLLCPIPGLWKSHQFLACVTAHPHCSLLLKLHQPQPCNSHIF